MTLKLRHLAVAIGLAAVSGAANASAQTIGAAQSFAVVGGTAVTAAGAGTTITGDVGVSPGTSITGIPGAAVVVPPFGTHANDAAANAAQAAATSLYAALVGTAGAVPLPMELGGTTVAPGVYSFGSTANIAAGTTLTLSGSGTYVFQVGSAITANALSQVILTNGASACDVYWQITSAATLNGIAFAGNVVAQAGISLGPGAQVTGRVLATAAGPVTMAGANSVGGCSAPPPPVCPAITLAPTSLPGGSVGVAYSQTITASGGAAPYVFGLDAGVLPPGLTLTPVGLLAGVPTTAGSFTITIRGTDADACFATVVHTIVIAAAPPPVCPTITLAPLTLPGGTVGLAYSQTITASGGAAPYGFDITAGALPAGLTLTATGLLAGTPSTADTTPVTIRATDTDSCLGTILYSIVIAAAPPPVCPAIALAPTTLPGGTAGIAYNQTITGSGGAAPYSFDVSVGSLPAGLTLTLTGVLAGTPIGAGTTPITIRGTDADGCFVTVAYSVVIAAAPPPPPVCAAIVLAPTTSAGGTVGIAFNQTITGNGGTAPYGFGVTAGALPAGLTLTAAGVLAGTPTTAGTSSVTIRGTDIDGCFATIGYTIVIAAAPPPPPGCPSISLAPTTLPGGTVGIAFNQTITGSSGTAPYSFGITAGALPAGLTLTSPGVLAGTPSTAGTSPFTIRGTDATGCFASLPFTLAIAAAPTPPSVCPTITLFPPTLPVGIVGRAFLQTFIGRGGAAPYSFGVTAGALPTGLALTSAGVLAGTPTAEGTSGLTIRATDTAGCFATLTVSVLITVQQPVPALPVVFLVTLALALLTLGWLRARRPAI